MSDDGDKASVGTALGQALLILVALLALDAAIVMFGLGALHGSFPRVPDVSFGDALVVAVLVRTFGRLSRGYHSTK